MANLIDIQFSGPTFDRAVAVLNAGQLRRALFQAIKRTGEKGVKIGQQEIQKTANITKKYIDRAIHNKLIIHDPAPPESIITITHRSLPLIAFKPRATKAGVSVKPWKNKPAKTWRHAFRATVNYQNATAPDELHEGIFIRTRHLPTKGPNVGDEKKTGKITAKGFAGRLAIKQLMGPSAESVAEIPEVQKAIADGLAGELEKRLQSQIDRFTK